MKLKIDLTNYLLMVDRKNTLSEFYSAILKSCEIM